MLCSSRAGRGRALARLQSLAGRCAHRPSGCAGSGRGLTGGPAPQEARYELLEQLEQFPLKVRAGEDEGHILADLTNREMEMAMDLRPWMQARSALSRTQPPCCPSFAA